MNIKLRATFPQGYRIFESISLSGIYYAIEDSEAKRMESIKHKYKDIKSRVPNTFSVRAFPFGIVQEQEDILFDITSRHHINHKLNDLVERVNWERSEEI